tara:strand:- start:29 stop:208 length:180 start_codon:yes stop_codon:yes gene_type:complete
MKYIVQWTEEVRYTVEVEAASPAEAKVEAFEDEAYEEAQPDFQSARVNEDSIKVKEVQA